MSCTDEAPCLNPILRWVHSRTCQERTRREPKPTPTREDALALVIQCARVYARDEATRRDRWRLADALKVYDRVAAGVGRGDPVTEAPAPLDEAEPLTRLEGIAARLCNTDCPHSEERTTQVDCFKCLMDALHEAAGTAAPDPAGRPVLVERIMLLAERYARAVGRGLLDGPGPIMATKFYLRVAVESVCRYGAAPAPAASLTRTDSQQHQPSEVSSASGTVAMEDKPADCDGKGSR